MIKIYVAHASGWDYETQLYNVLEQTGLAVDFVFPHRDMNVITHSKQTIESCDLFLAEVSYPSTGLGIELAWAQAAGIPILAVHRVDCAPSSAIRTMTQNIHVYQNTDALIDIVRKFFKAE